VGYSADHVVPTEEYVELYLHLPIRIQSVELKYILRFSSYCTVNSIRLGCENQVVNYESENNLFFFP
jgi:hypothetical protein